MDTDDVKQSSAHSTEIKESSTTTLDINHHNVNAEELDEDTNAKLRGDAIGNTLYSQSFVLKTLLQFSDLNWNEETEENLCFLWDMTVENDVCDFLFDVKYPSIASSAIVEYNEENRFIEIVIGILANIMCSNCNKKLTDEEICTVLRMISSDDHLILVQVMRFISALAHKTDDLSFITEEYFDFVLHILCNSTNKELLSRSLEAVSKLTRDFKLNNDLINLNLYNSIITAYQTLIDDQFLDSSDNVAALKYMLEIITNILSYIDNYQKCELLVDLQKNCNPYVEEVIKIVKYFTDESNLIRGTEEITYFMSVFRYSLTTLNISYSSILYIPLCSILHSLLDLREENEELFDSIVELICFLMSRTELSCVQKDLKNWSKTKTKKILNVIIENHNKYDYNVHVQELVKECG